MSEKSLKVIKESDFLMIMGVRLEESLEFCAKEFIYMHPIDNKSLNYTQYVKYEVGGEEGVISMLLDAFAKNASSDVEEFIEELDIGYISAESNVGEEEIEEILEKSQNFSNKTLIVGKELFLQDNCENIKALLKALKSSCDLNIICSDDSINLDTNSKLEEPSEILAYNGTVVYNTLDNKTSLKASASFLKAAKVNDKDRVKIVSKDLEISRVIELDETLLGTIALFGVEENEYSSENYPYVQAKILRMPDDE